ncbi:MAG: HD domain-containing protein [Firmicutes bacterium]|nr:HD domain-containing protein [Bacillota bacterium]
MGLWGQAMVRVKQFYRALTAKIEPADRDFLQKYLGEQERALFYQMDPIDQRHCLDVAQHAYRIATARGLGPKRATLVKAALLHDIGKIRGETTLLTRVAYVLRRRSIERRSGAKTRILSGHAERGAHMAETFGIDPEIVELIRDHHKQPTSKLAALLHEADSMF